MKRLSKIQIQELTSLGLTQHQLEECESVLINVPPLFDEKKVNMLKNFLSKAEKILDEFERNDPRLFNEIQSFLGDGLLLEQKPLSGIQDALSTVKQNQKGAYIVEATSGQSSPSINIVTPESRDFYRIDHLKRQWEHWGKTVKLSRSTEFMMFLTICIDGKYSDKGENRVRTNYYRYYKGKKVDSVEVIDRSQPEDVWEVETTYKSVDGEPSVVKTQKLNIPRLHTDNIAEHVKELNKKRN